MEITKHGKPLDKSLYDWDEKNKTISTLESYCTINCGDDYTIYCGFDCKIVCGLNCKINCGPDCTIDCVSYCKIDCGSAGVIKCGSNCIINCGDNCTIDCRFNSIVNCDEGGTIDCGSNCTINCQGEYIVVINRTYFGVVEAKPNTIIKTCDDKVFEEINQDTEEETINIDGKEVSTETIKNALKKYFNN